MDCKGNSKSCYFKKINNYIFWKNLKSNMMIIICLNGLVDCTANAALCGWYHLPPPCAFAHGYKCGSATRLLIFRQIKQKFQAAVRFIFGDNRTFVEGNRIFYNG